MFEIPVGAEYFIWAIAAVFAVFTFMLMIVVYEAATEAKEFFKRANEENRAMDQTRTAEPLHQDS